jgi:glycosyltransferase involved in cell wall biosynthesis
MRHNLRRNHEPNGGHQRPGEPAAEKADQPLGDEASNRRLRISDGPVKVSVVIPALNEAENLPHVLPGVARWADEIVLVDGRSHDGTIEIARRLHPAIRIVEEQRPGKGAALKSGVAAATGDVIVMMDADGSTDPAEIPRFVGALLGGADFAKGSRFVHGAGTSDMPHYRRLGNFAHVLLVRMFFGGRFSDLNYGYNAIWADAVPSLDLDGGGFEIEAVMNIRALRAGLLVVEVASFEKRRVHGVSNLRTFPDGWRVLKAIVRERFGAQARHKTRHTSNGGFNRFSAYEGEALADALAPRKRSPSRSKQDDPALL